MNFDKLVEFLEKRLLGKMPGPAAHDLMKPRLPSGQSFTLTHPTQPKAGAVLILLFEKEGAVYFPLIQRAEYDGIHSGQIALPGGKAEPSDEHLIATALREAEEEIGIDASQVEVIGSLSTFYVMASNYTVLPVIGTVHGSQRWTPDPREVHQIIDAPLSSLLAPALKKEKEMDVRAGVRLVCPYYLLGGKEVWGATAMMLSELAAILPAYEQT